MLKLSYGGQATKDQDRFYWGGWSLNISCKDFNLAIGGGLGWVKRLKIGQGRFIFHAIIPAQYPFW